LKVDFFRKYLLNFSQKFLNSPYGGGVVVVSDRGGVGPNCGARYQLLCTLAQPTQEPRKSHARATQYALGPSIFHSFDSVMPPLL